jgi:hypothetical protein
MSRNSHRWLIIVLSVSVALLGIGTVSTLRNQNYRLHKIDFIIWDNQHENMANLTREQFADYLQRCGARVKSSAALWTVHYDGFLDHQTWSFAFAEPKSDLQ